MMVPNNEIMLESGTEEVNIIHEIVNKGINSENITILPYKKIESPIKKKIFLCVPTTTDRGVCPELLGFLIAYKKKFDDPNDPLDGQVAIMYRNSQSINNNLLADAFLKETDCTHYFKLDSDIVPYAGLVERVLELDKPILALAVAIYKEEIDGIMTCIYNGKKGAYELIDFVKNPLGICQYAGGGAMCISREVLQALKQPFWDIELNDTDGDMKLASDERFSQMILAAGYNFWYDASKILGQHHDIIIGGEYEGNIDTRQNIIMHFSKTGNNSIKKSKGSKYRKLAS